MSSIYKLQSTPATIHTHPLSGSYTPSQYSSALIIPSSGIRQLRTSPILQSLLKVLWLAKPTLAYPVSPVHSHGNHNKGSWSVFPTTASTSWPSPRLSHVALQRITCPLFGTVSNKISSIVISWPVSFTIPENNKTHILKYPSPYLCSSLSCVSIQPQCEPLRRGRIFCPTL